MIRKPAVAGQFYPSDKIELLKTVKSCLNTGAKKEKAIGVVSPHAGYIYSGQVAGSVFSSIEVPKVVVVISPNHTGRGAPAAIISDGEWETPLGRVKIDGRFARALMEECPNLREDALAHTFEHSLEVQLPFLQVLRPDVNIVPITVSHLRFSSCEELGHAIAQVVRKITPSPNGVELGENVLIVASSDMTHYEPCDVAKQKDSLAIERILALDARGLLDTCAREDITMCGVVPVAIMLIAAKELGARSGKLIKYATSFDVTRDYDQVVGYAGILILP